MPSIKKIKIMASPNIPKEDVKDMLHNGLHMMHKFEDEMDDHPFGHKLISMWQDYNERDTITMIKAFTQLSSDDKRLVLSVKGLWS